MTAAVDVCRAGGGVVLPFRCFCRRRLGLLARLLLDRGADLLAEAQMYGGGQTALALASTSAHPHKAGVAPELLGVLAPGAGSN